jgi:hypothetical protein
VRIVRLVRTFFQKESGLFSPRPVKLAFSSWPICPSQEVFSDPKSLGNKSSNEGHG